MLPVLSLLETRVLGVLIEKEKTVPDSYPLTLNTLVSGCNQKTSRDPVISASEIEVQQALDRLKELSLIIESSGSRVARYEHNAGRVMRLPSQSLALLTVLMLRGPQTPGELRINSERMHRFADIGSVETFLAELAEHSSGAMVMELPRQAGSRENRWTHLLSGMPEISAEVAGGATAPSTEIGASELAALKANVTRLQAEVDSLRATVLRLCAELGVKPD